MIYSFHFLWEFNSFHRKQTLPRYLYHSRQTINGKKVKRFRFSKNSQILCLDQLIKIEEQFLNKYVLYSLFPQFLKDHKVVHSIPIQTKTRDSRFIFTSSIQGFLSCPCTSPKELDILQILQIYNICTQRSFKLYFIFPHKL